MNDTESLPLAWEPVTPRGVAAFAYAGLRRLLLVQLLVALLAGAVVVMFLYRDWVPVIRAAILAMPTEGEMSGEQLFWTGPSAVQLAANPFLGITVDLNHSNVMGRSSHLQVEFGRKDYRLISLVGYTPIDYPPGWRMPFNRTELIPWWGAWQPLLLFAAGFGTVISLLLVWTLLATLYMLPMRLLTFLQSRDLNWGQSWKLSGAALMPGALFFTFSIFAYSVGMVDLIRLGGLAVLHVLVGWIYLLVSPPFLRRNHPRELITRNPFEGPGMPGGNPPAES